MYEVKLNEIANLGQIRSKVKELHSVINLPVALLDKKNNLIAVEGWQEFYGEYSANDEPAQCLQSPTKTIKIKGKSYLSVMSPLGLRVIILPMVINKVEVGELIISGFLSSTDKVDTKALKQVCEENKINFDDFKAFIKKVPRLSRERMGEIVAIGELFVNLIVEFFNTEAIFRELYDNYLWLFESANDSILIIDADTHKIVDCNRKSAELFGMSKEEILGKTPYDLSPEYQSDGQFSEQRVKDFLRRACQGENLVFEWLHKKGDGTSFETEVSLNCLDYVYTKVVLAIVRDITIKKIAERYYIEKEKFFTTLFEKSNDANFLLFENRFIGCNEKTVELFGYTRKEDIIGKHPSEISPEFQPDGRKSFEKAEEMMKIAFQEGYHRFEWMHKKSNGDLIPAEVTLTPFIWEGKALIYAVVRDISKRKKYEEELKFQKEFLETVINFTPNLIFVKDYEGRFRLVNKAVAEVYETKEENIIGKTDADFNPFEEEVTSFLLNDREVMDNLSYKFIPEEPVSSPSGKTRWFQTEKKGFVAPNGERLVLGVSVDITEIKKAHSALKESQEQFRTLAEKSPISIIGFDKDFIINFVNDYHLNEFSAEGYGAEYYIGRDIRSLAFLISDELVESFEKLLVNEPIEVNEYYVPILPNGRSAYFNVRISPVFKQGEFEGGILILQDVSEIVNARRNAELVSKNLAVTLDSIGDAVIVTDAMGYIVRMNPVAEQLTGWKCEDALNKPLEEVFNICNALTGVKVENPVEKVIKKGQIVGLANHTMLISRDGTKYHIADSAAPIRAEDDSITGVIMVFRDVTDKYISEQVLRENEERLRNAQKAGNIGSWELDVETQMFWGSEEAFNIFGIPRTIPVMSYQTLRGLIHPSDLEYFDNEFAKLITEYDTSDVEFKIINQETNETRIVLIHTFVMFDENGGLVKIVGTIQDITERKVREILLKLHNDISFALMSSATFEDALKAILDKVTTIEWIDCGGVYLFNSETKALELHAHRGLSEEFIKKVSYYAPDSPNVKIVLKGETVFAYYNHFAKEHSIDKKNDLKFLGVFPIKIGNEVIGSLNIGSHKYDSVPETVKESLQAVLSQVSGILAKLRLEKVKDELQRSLNTLINNLNGIVYRCRNDKDWTMEFLSYACKEITGYEPQDFIGNSKLTWNSIIYYLDQERVWNEVQEAIESKKQYQLVYRIVTSNAQIKWVWEQGEGIYDENGNLEFLEGYIVDITEQQHLREMILASEERYKKIFNLSPQLILISDEDGRIIESNDTLQNWLGYSYEEVEGSLISDLVIFDANQRENLLAEIKAHLESSSRTPMELDLIAKNGDKKIGWLLPTYFNIREEERRIMLMITDVTEKRLNERMQEVILEISVSANTTESIADFSKVVQDKLGKLIDTTNFFIVFYNKEADTLSFSYFADEVDKIEEFPAGKTLTRYLIKNDLSLLLKEEDIRRLIAEGHIELFGTMAKAWLGVPLKVENEIVGAVVVQSYKDENAYTQTHLKMMQIVSEQVALAIKRKHYQQLVTESEEKYRTLTEQLPVGVYRTTQDGRILFANQFLARLLEFDSVEELLAENIAYFMIDGRSFEEQLKKVKDSSEGVFRQEFRMKTHKGNIIWVRDVYRAVYDKNGNFLYFDGTLEDITLRKQAEEEIIKLNQSLEQKVIERTKQLETALEELRYENEERKRVQEALYVANEEITKALQKEKELGELKTRFMSMISHEYRTPLTVILNSSYIIEQLYEGIRKKEFMEYVIKIRHAIKEMTSLLEEVLIVGKSEAGKLVYYPQNVKIYQFVKNIVDEIIMVDKNRHNIIFNAKPTEIVIETDEKLLKQVLTNLLSNALKYSPEKTEVVFGMMVFPDEIIFTVKDQGIGISPADMKHIFTPFHRGKNVGTVGGTGLGLAIVKSCVETMGGDISVNSVLGEGTTFTVKIPLRIVHEG